MSRGVVPSFAIALLRTRHASGLVRQLALTTHPIGAEDAVQHGLANVLVPDTEQAERHAHGLLSLWSQVGAAAVRSTTQTLADVDAAPDHDALRQIAVDGVEEQLRRFGEGQTDQNYLNVDGTADLPDM
jgi:enoyl-CoA hydratase/carnithine racemase